MAGVYEINVLGLRLRIVVPNQLPPEEHNALLHLFSTRGELLAYGCRHYQVHSRDASTLLLQLFRRIQEEVGAMSTAIEEFARETIDELLKKLPVEKRLEGLTPEQRVQGLSAAELRALADQKDHDATGETAPRPPRD
jgi:hypothetical protein